MVHGGTNFGFFSGANVGTGPSDFQPAITSYDYVSLTVIGAILQTTCYSFVSSIMDKNGIKNVTRLCVYLIQ